MYSNETLSSLNSVPVSQGHALSLARNEPSHLIKYQLAGAPKINIMSLCNISFYFSDFAIYAKNRSHEKLGLALDCSC